MLDEKSLELISYCDPQLQDLFEKVSQQYPCKVICGFRGEQEQNEAYKKGASKLQWPKSKHNKTPSVAVDVVPLPINWEDIKAFERFCWFVKGVALGMGIELTSGGVDWPNFRDMPHFELKG